MMALIKKFIKKTLFYIFGYQHSIDWEKRLKNLGINSIYNDSTPKSERTSQTLAQNARYSIFLSEVFSDLNHGCRILDYGCGWGRHLELLKKTSGSTQIVGYDPFGDLFDNVTDGYNEKITSPELLMTLPKFDMVFIHLVIGGFNDKKLRDEFELIRSIIKTNGYIFLVEACSDNEKKYSSWKIRKPETYFSLARDFKWNIKDIINESEDDLYIIVGKRMLKSEIKKNDLDN